MSVADDMEALRDACDELKRVMLVEIRANWPLLVFIYLAVVAVAFVVASLI
jgi:hypothetical protein